MKTITKFITCLFVALMSVTTSFAQVTLSQEQLDSLPKSVRMAIETEVAKTEIKENITTVSEYAGLGREIGEAVNGALTAVEEHVISLSETDLGKTAIFIVCWKLLYKDFIYLFIGIVLLAVLCVWIFRMFNWFTSKDNLWSEWSDEKQFSFFIFNFLEIVAFFVASMCFLS